MRCKRPYAGLAAGATQASDLGPRMLGNVRCRVQPDPLALHRPVRPSADTRHAPDVSLQAIKVPHLAAKARRPWISLPQDSCCSCTFFGGPLRQKPSDMPKAEGHLAFGGKGVQGCHAQCPLDCALCRNRWPLYRILALLQAPGRCSGLSLRSLGCAWARAWPSTLQQRFAA